MHTYSRTMDPMSMIGLLRPWRETRRSLRTPVSGPVMNITTTVKEKMKLSKSITDNRLCIVFVLQQREIKGTDTHSFCEN